MNCRDVREVADSFLCEQLLTETNHGILRHLETCPSCRTEVDARRRLRGALRAAVDRAPELQPAGEFENRLRGRLREAAVLGHRSRTFSGRWLALAAGLILAAGVTAAMLLQRSPATTEALALDAVGDHRNCAIKYRLAETPVPLEEAAQRFDSAYRVLVSAPPDDTPTPDGPVHVVERHSCAYGAHRFGHVVLRYRGRIVSLLVTANDETSAAAATKAVPHVIGRTMEGLSVVSVNGSRHAVMLVGDLEQSALAQLAGVVSLPLVQRLASVATGRAEPTARLFVRPLQGMARDADEGLKSASLLAERLPVR
jgi:hypothetical protein